MSWTSWSGSRRCSSGEEQAGPPKVTARNGRCCDPRPTLRHCGSSHGPGPRRAAGVVTDGDDLVWVSVTLPAGHPDADFVWKFSDGRTSAAFRLTGGADSEVTTEHQFTGGDNTVSATLVDSDGREIGRWAGTVTRPGRAEALRRTVSSDDFAIGVVAFLLAVGSGIVALYLPSATWGSAGDYVTALFWGSATSEGIKAAANVAGKVGPITS